MKRIVIFLSLLVIVCVLVGCENSNSGNNNVVIKTETVVEKNEPVVEQKKEIAEVSIGDTIKNEDYELTINELGFKDKVEFKTSEYSYRSVSADQGKVLLILEGSLKNLMGEKIEDWYSMKCKVVIDDKYNYDGRLEAIDDFDPLVDARFVLYANVPESIEETYKSAQLIFGFNDQFKADYNNKVDDLDNLFSISLKNEVSE